MSLRRTDKHFYLLDNEDPVPGITSIIGVLDKPALVAWAAEQAGRGAVEYGDMIAAHVGHETTEMTCPICTSGKPWHKTADDRLGSWLRGLPYAKRDAAGNAGTAVHAIAEAIAKGETPDVTKYEDFTRAFMVDFVEKYHPTFHSLYVEAMVYHAGDDGTILPYGGTMDLFCRIGDETWLIDHKTTKSGIYPETALQLAGGRFAQFIGLPDDPKRYPIPKVDRCGVLWIRPEGAELIPYDVTPREFQAFAAARMAWDWVNHRAKEVKGAA